MRDKSSHEHKLVPESDNPGDKIGIPNIAWINTLSKTLICQPY